MIRGQTYKSDARPWLKNRQKNEALGFDSVALGFAPFGGSAEKLVV